MRRVLLSVALSVGVSVCALACGDDPPSGSSSGEDAGGGGNGGGGGGGDADGSAPTPGCGVADVAKGFSGGLTLDVGGAERTYGVFVPDGYDGKRALPVVFVFHGDGGSGEGIRRSMGLEEVSAGGAIFVYPDGLSKTWSINDAEGLGRDVGFVDALAEQVSARYCVDGNRLFAAGFSKGAYFTNMVACLGKVRLRGVATHAGGGPFGVSGSGTSFDGSGNLQCPSPPVAALQVQGESDGPVPPSEGMKARDHWRRQNGCGASTEPYAPAPCVAYQGCAPERPEVWCLVPGLGHQIWPEHGAQVSWDFFSAL